MSNCCAKQEATLLEKKEIETIEQDKDKPSTWSNIDSSKAFIVNYLCSKANKDIYTNYELQVLTNFILFEEQFASL